MRQKMTIIQSVMIMCFTIAGVLLDVFVFGISSDIRIFALLGMYVYILHRWRVRSDTTFGICLILLGITYVLFLFTVPMAFDDPRPIPPPAERTAVWLYLFLLIGIVQKWRE